MREYFLFFSFLFPFFSFQNTSVVYTGLLAEIKNSLQTSNLVDFSFSSNNRNKISNIYIYTDECMRTV